MFGMRTECFPYIIILLPCMLPYDKTNFAVHAILCFRCDIILSLPYELYPDLLRETIMHEERTKSGLPDKLSPVCASGTRPHRS